MSCMLAPREANSGHLQIDGLLGARNDAFTSQCVDALVLRHGSRLQKGQCTTSHPRADD